jgi:hypothetical protein
MKTECFSNDAFLAHTVGANMILLFTIRLHTFVALNLPPNVISKVLDNFVRVTKEKLIVVTSSR